MTVEELLQGRGFQYRISGQDFLIKCLNPDHPDTNPSFRVDKISGAAHCFSCGFKTNIYKYFNVFTNHTPAKIAKIKEKLKAVQAATTGLELPEGATPYTRPFRGISAATLKHVGAFYTTREPKLEDRIVFPIKDIRGKIQVFVARHLLSNSANRYLNYPSGVEIPLYPASAPIGEKHIVLVEGITDYLNLYDKGLKTAVCTFGVNTICKDTKLKTLPYRAQGVQKVYIMFDGDEAGRKGAAAAKPLLEELGFTVEIIDLPDDLDPGSLDQEYVSSIKEYISDLEIKS
jgi:DNA primase